MARLEAATRTKNIGNVLTQIPVLGSRGNSRSPRRESSGPDPSSGGGTSGRTMRDAEVLFVVDVNRTGMVLQGRLGKGIDVRHEDWRGERNIVLVGFHSPVDAVRRLLDRMLTISG